MLLDLGFWNLAMHASIRELKVTLMRLLRVRRRGMVHMRSRLAVGIPEVTDVGLRQLMTEGAISWNGEKLQPKDPVVLSSGGTPVSQGVIEGRG